MIGERLAEIRKDYDDRQSDLAEKLNVTVAAVRSWEQQKSSPSHEILVNICRLYHVSADYLLGLSDIGPAYVRRRRLEAFSETELAELNNYEQYLIWKKQRKKDAFK